MFHILPQGAPRPAALAILLTALSFGVRAAFVASAPGEPTADARFYHAAARALAAGRGYVEVDGSAAVHWMPGWPAALALIYVAAGEQPRAGMIACAALGAATTGLVVMLGAHWFRRGVGALAGAIHALWPGQIYYAATLMSEPAFTFLLAAALLALAIGTGGPRLLRFALAAGACLGLAAWVRSEALAVAGALALAVGWLRPSRAGALAAALVVLIPVLSLVPWGLRNLSAYGTFLLTSANAGPVLYIANHPHGLGTYLPALHRELARRARPGTRDRGSETLAAHRLGMREGLRFLAQDPRGLGARGVRKLRDTYASDSFGATLIRGFAGAGPLAGRRLSGVPGGGYMPESRRAALALVADRFWAGVLALAALGLATVHRWPSGARALVAGTLAPFLALHFVTLGGARFHYPEAPLLAVVAALGARTVARAAGALRRRTRARSAVA